MVLSMNDFVTYRINWDDKATNIKKISNNLNIGMDSIVFFDDNPVTIPGGEKSLDMFHSIELHSLVSLSKCHPNTSSPQDFQDRLATVQAAAGRSQWQEASLRTMLTLKDLTVT